MPIAEEKKIESVEFIAILNDMLEIIDNIAPLINENNYLQLCNNLKRLNDNDYTKSVKVITEYITVVRERVIRNRVVALHNKRIRMKTLSREDVFTDEEKLKKGWSICPKCDRIVLNITEHQFTDVCKRTEQSKKISYKCPTQKTDKYTYLVCRLRAIFIRYEGYKYYMKLIKNKISI